MTLTTDLPEAEAVVEQLPVPHLGLVGHVYTDGVCECGARVSDAEVLVTHA